MNEGYIHVQQTVHHMLSPIIFCPKRRRKVLVGPVHDRLKEIIEAVVREHAWKSERLAIQPDHVHLFIQSHPDTTPLDSARLIKGRSSHVLREAFDQLMRLPSLWTRSTFSSTAGCVSQQMIDRSIERPSKS